MAISDFLPSGITFFLSSAQWELFWGPHWLNVFSKLLWKYCTCLHVHWKIYCFCKCFKKDYRSQVHVLPHIYSIKGHTCNRWMIFVLICLSYCGCRRGWGHRCVPTRLKCWITTTGLPLIPLTSHHGQTLQCLTCQWHTTDCYWLALLLLPAKFITGSTKVVWNGHRGWSFSKHLKG